MGISWMWPPRKSTDYGVRYRDSSYRCQGRGSTSAKGWIRLRVNYGIKARPFCQVNSRSQSSGTEHTDQQADMTTQTNGPLPRPLSSVLCAGFR